MGTVSTLIQVEQSTSETSLRTYAKAMVCTLILTELNMMVIGNTTKKMERELIPGQKVISTKVNMKKANQMVKVLSPGPMEADTKGSGRVARDMGLASTLQLMANLCKWFEISILNCLVKLTITSRKLRNEIAENRI